MFSAGNLGQKLQTTNIQMIISSFLPAYNQLMLASTSHKMEEKTFSNARGYIVRGEE